MILSSFISRRNPQAPPPIFFNSSIHQAIDSLLQRCRAMAQLKQLHALLLTHGLLSATLTVSKLLAFCSLSDAGDIRYARLVFDRLPETNTFMWNTLIRGYSNSPNPREALVLHRRMLRSGLRPNDFTLPFLLKSSAKISASKETLMLHAMIFKLGFESQVFVANALMNAYASCGPVQIARKVFDDIPERNVVSWNSIIGGYSGSGDCGESVVLFRAMIDENFEPDGFTLVNVLSTCAQAGNLNFGRAIHHYIVVTAANIDLILGNALVDMYGKCGDLCAAKTCFDRITSRNVVAWTSILCAYAKHGLLDVARDWFDRMPEKSIVSWNAMITCYVQHGFFCQALDLYSSMKTSRVFPDEITLVAALSACSQTGYLVIGKEIHNYISENIAEPGTALTNSLVDMYSKCGFLDTALELFNTMPRKSTVSWNVIIAALAMYGLAFDAIALFKEMLGNGFSPDAITFTGLLCACSHGGLLEIGQHYFESMNSIFNVQKDIEHYACMVDLLGRRGRLVAAVEVIKSMPMRPDVVIWGALLGACRIHANMKIGEQVMKHILELEPRGGGLYVLVSNMYSEKSRWREMNKLRKLMRENGIAKDKATSLIEINNHVHEFLVQDTRHESSSAIYCVLDGLTDHMMSMWCSSVEMEGLLEEQL